MSSKTLEHILKHWTDNAKFATGVARMPFDVELFCRENDELLQKSQNAIMELRSLCGDVHADGFAEEILVKYGFAEKEDDEEGE